MLVLLPVETPPVVVRVPVELLILVEVLLPVDVAEFVVVPVVDLPVVVVVVVVVDLPVPVPVVEVAVVVLLLLVAAPLAVPLLPDVVASLLPLRVVLRLLPVVA